MKTFIPENRLKSFHDQHESQRKEPQQIDTVRGGTSMLETSLKKKICKKPIL